MDEFAKYFISVPRATVAVVGIHYVQFYGAFIVQCPRPHLRQQRQQKMKKRDLSKNPVHSLLSRKQPITTVHVQPLKSSSTNRAVFNAKQFQDGNMELADAYKCNQGIRFSICWLLRIEDIMRLSYASSEINAMLTHTESADDPRVYRDLHFEKHSFRISPPIQPFTHIFQFLRPAFMHKVHLTATITGQGTTQIYWPL
ncbi:hypothetical protein T12_13788 [Trichinella patagoniensis]|uniref:Uncharacterized protein n=1 Tax=Trichinella patagoniensis TaxID=990121 RepID=A0A0V0ZNX0_9BILA|nr:hypothetical protein T12_13788 [Trichinella patagoniensis]